MECNSESHSLQTDGFKVTGSREMSEDDPAEPKWKKKIIMQTTLLACRLVWHQIKASASVLNGHDYGFSIRRTAL